MSKNTYNKSNVETYYQWRLNPFEINPFNIMLHLRVNVEFSFTDNLFNPSLLAETNLDPNGARFK